MSKYENKGQAEYQLEVPEEMRKIIENGIKQAQSETERLMDMAGEVINKFEVHSGAAQVEIADFRKKSLAAAEANMASAFDLAKKMAEAKDINEIFKLQVDYFTQQFEISKVQMQEVGKEFQRCASLATEGFNKNSEEFKAGIKQQFAKATNVKNKR